MLRKSLSIVLLLIFFIGFGQKSVLKKQISEITKGKNATVAVSVNGIGFPFTFHNENASKKLPMLSVFKFHVALATLNLVDQGKFSLSQKFLIKKEDLLLNTYSPLRDRFPAGNIELTLDELIWYSVSLSDNNTTDVLLRLIGGTETVQNFMDSRNVRDFQIKNNEAQMHQGTEFFYPNYTSTKSLTKLYKDFHQGKIVSEQSTDYLFRILQRTETGGNKLKEQLPAGSVANKTGSSGKDKNGLTVAENDSGIITLPNGKRYAVSVFISDSTESYETNCRMISDISRKIWDYLSVTGN